MKRNVGMRSCALYASVPSLYMYAVMENAARFFSALFFWFFSFIFTCFPIRKKQLA